jgi:hypothetical protein
VTVTGALQLEPMAKTAAERKAAERERLAKAGYVLLPGKAAWVPEKDLKRVLKYLQLLRDRHEKKLAKE